MRESVPTMEMHPEYNAVMHSLAWETFYHQCKPERHAESRRNMLSPW